MFIFFHKLYRAGESIRKYLIFILQIIGWVIILYILIPIFISFFNGIFKGVSISTSDFILLITAAFILAYTYETQKMKEQVKENDLRPTILRSGFIENWDKINFEFSGEKLISGKPIEFKILKGIATDIGGYVVINRHKYKLLFGNDIAKIDEQKISFLPSWGWMGPNSFIYGVFKKDDNNKVLDTNKIVLFYKDIEGNEYTTIEDENFSQKSYKF